MTDLKKDNKHMKYLIIFLLLITIAISAQESIGKLDADTFIGVDNLEHVYFIKNNVLFKKSDSKTLSYTNLHLGEITQVDITNPLKIVVFYKNFNSVIVLDDALNELSNSINFNSVLLKNISFVGTSSNSNLWLFTEDENSLILFNYFTQKIILTKQLDQDFTFLTAFSNYHYLWLISNSKILTYNAYGSFIKQYNIKNIEKATIYKNGIIYKTGNNLYHLINDNNPKLIATNKDLSIKDFYINNNLLYFFDGNVIYSHEFSKN